MLRIADIKYRETKIVDTYAEALQKLLEDNIFPPNYVPPYIHEFRTKELWTVEVNDLFMTNVVPLKNVNKLFSQSY